MERTAGAQPWMRVVMQKHGFEEVRNKKILHQKRHFEIFEYYLKEERLGEREGERERSLGQILWSSPTGLLFWSPGTMDS